MARISLSKTLFFAQIPVVAVLVAWLIDLPLRWSCPAFDVACSHIGYNWLAFGLDALFYSAIGYSVFLVYPYFPVFLQQERIQEGIDLAKHTSLHKALLYALIPTFAVLLTWLTGFLGYPFERPSSQQGLPLSWRTTLGCGASMFTPCIRITYDWSAFLLDVLFYAAFGYGLTSVWFHVGNTTDLPSKHS